MRVAMTRSVVIGIAAVALTAGRVGSTAAQDGTLGGLLGAMDTAQTLSGADARRASETKAAGAAKVGEPQAAGGEAAPAEGGQPLAAGAGEAVVSYDATKHRDPFRPPNLGNVETAARTPLERYQIGQLKLVGVVWEAGAPRAMVEDSSGLGYIVSAGTPIGSSGGVVRRIEPRRVLIEETVTNFYGEKEPREVVMALPEEDRSP